MPDYDLLTHVLDRPDKAVRKADGVVEPAPNGQGDESGYDLTNPNLHHGAEAKYGPTLQALNLSGSVIPPGGDVLSGPGQVISESFHLAVERQRTDRYRDCRPEWL